MANKNTIKRHNPQNNNESVPGKMIDTFDELTKYESIRAAHAQNLGPGYETYAKLDLIIGTTLTPQTILSYNDRLEIPMKNTPQEYPVQQSDFFNYGHKNQLLLKMGIDNQGKPILQEFELTEPEKLIREENSPAIRSAQIANSTPGKETLVINPLQRNLTYKTVDTYSAVKDGLYGRPQKSEVSNQLMDGIACRQSNEQGLMQNITPMEISLLTQRETEFATLIKNNEMGFSTSQEGITLIKQYLQTQIDNYTEAKINTPQVLNNRYAGLNNNLEIAQHRTKDFETVVSSSMFTAKDSENKNNFYIAFCNYQINHINDAINHKAGYNPEEITSMQEKLKQYENFITFTNLRSQWEENLTNNIIKNPAEDFEKTEKETWIASLSNKNGLTENHYDLLMISFDDWHSKFRAQHVFEQGKDSTNISDERAEGYISQLIYMGDMIRHHPSNPLNKPIIPSDSTINYDYQRVDIHALKKMNELNSNLQEGEENKKLTLSMLSSREATDDFIKKYEADETMKGQIDLAKQVIAANCYSISQELYDHINSTKIEEKILNSIKTSYENNEPFRYNDLLTLVKNGASSEYIQDFLVTKNNLDYFPESMNDFFKSNELMTAISDPKLIKLHGIASTDDENNKKKELEVNPLAKYQIEDFTDPKKCNEIKANILLSINQAKENNLPTSSLERDLEFMNNHITANRLEVLESQRVINNYQLDNIHAVRLSPKDISELETLFITEKTNIRINNYEDFANPDFIKQIMEERIKELNNQNKNMEAPNSKESNTEQTKENNFSDDKIISQLKSYLSEERAIANYSDIKPFLHNYEEKEVKEAKEILQEIKTFNELIDKVKENPQLEEKPEFKHLAFLENVSLEEKNKINIDLSNINNLTVDQSIEIIKEVKSFNKLVEDNNTHKTFEELSKENQESKEKPEFKHLTFLGKLPLEESNTININIPPTTQEQLQQIIQEIKVFNELIDANSTNKSYDSLVMENPELMNKLEFKYLDFLTEIPLEKQNKIDISIIENENGISYSPAAMYLLSKELNSSNQEYLRNLGDELSSVLKQAEPDLTIITIRNNCENIISERNLTVSEKETLFELAQNQSTTAALRTLQNAYAEINECSQHIEALNKMLDEYKQAPKESIGNKYTPNTNVPTQKSPYEEQLEKDIAAYENRITEIKADIKTYTEHLRIEIDTRTRSGEKIDSIGPSKLEELFSDTNILKQREDAFSSQKESLEQNIKDYMSSMNDYFRYTREEVTNSVIAMPLIDDNTKIELQNNLKSIIQTGLLEDKDLETVQKFVTQLENGKTNETNENKPLNDNEIRCTLHDCSVIIQGIERETTITPETQKIFKELKDMDENLSKEETHKISNAEIFSQILTINNFKSDETLQHELAALKNELSLNRNYVQYIVTVQEQKDQIERLYEKLDSVNHPQERLSTETIEKWLEENPERGLFQSGRKIINTIRTEYLEELNARNDLSNQLLNEIYQCKENIKQINQEYDSRIANSDTDVEFLKFVALQRAIDSIEKYMETSEQISPHVKFNLNPELVRMTIDGNINEATVATLHNPVQPNEITSINNERKEQEAFGIYTNSLSNMSTRSAQIILEHLDSKLEQIESDEMRIKELQEKAKNLSTKEEMELNDLQRNKHELNQADKQQLLRIYELYEKANSNKETAISDITREHMVQRNNMSVNEESLIVAKLSLIELPQNIKEYFEANKDELQNAIGEKTIEPTKTNEADMTEANTAEANTTESKKASDKQVEEDADVNTHNLVQQPSQMEVGG